MAEPSTRTTDDGRHQYRDSTGAWHDSPTAPAASSSSSGDDSSDDSGGGTTRTLSAPTGNARTVAGLMGVAMIFSVIGAEVKALNPPKGGVQLPKAFSEPFVILAGGTIATVFLVLISDLGDTGRQFAVGLAGLAAVTAVLVNGAPVWTAILNLTSSKPTAPTAVTATTSPTGATAPA